MKNGKRGRIGAWHADRSIQCAGCSVKAIVKQASPDMRVTRVYPGWMRFEMLCVLNRGTFTESAVV